KELLNSDTIAVIGTRRPSIYGVSANKKLVKELMGVTVVSGLALGTDKIAHETAIEIGTKNNCCST
ncbi:MAG: DNA-processing protein DprA, partial [Mogibacterium sp.]|nr:DNA-processing protein DprA [Mogibacterium sp.]